MNIAGVVGKWHLSASESRGEGLWLPVETRATRAIAERLAVPVSFEMISEQKRDETNPTHCL